MLAGRASTAAQIVARRRAVDGAKYPMKLGIAAKTRGARGFQQIGFARIDEYLNIIVTRKDS